MIQKVSAFRSGIIPFKIRNSCRCPAAMFRRPLKAHWWTCFLFAFCLLTLAHTITSTKSRYFYNLCSAGLPLLFSSVVEATFGTWFWTFLYWMHSAKVKTSSSAADLEWFRRKFKPWPSHWSTSSICFPISRWSSSLFFTSPQLHTIYGIFTTRLNKSSSVRHPHECASFWRLSHTFTTTDVFIHSKGSFRC